MHQVRDRRYTSTLVTKCHISSATAKQLSRLNLNWLNTYSNCDISVNSHRRIARVIYDKHISEDCGEPVNLPQRESSTILNALESESALNRFLFDDAAEECDLNSHINIWYS